MVHRDSAHILVVAGPKGGCGKTTFATSLARGLASCNKKCLLVEMSSAMRSAAMALNIPAEALYADDGRAVSEAGAQEEGGKQGAILATPYERLDYTTAASNADEHDIATWKAAQYDHIIVDLPPGMSCENLIFAADMVFLLAIPEPDSIYACSAWLRHILEIRLREAGFEAYLTPNWSYNDLLEALPEDRVADLEHAVMARRVCFVLNARREGSEEHQSDALCHAWGRYFGADVRWMGSLRFEERRWFYARRCTNDDPLLQEDSIQSEVAQIAARVLAPNFEKRRCLGSLHAIRHASEFLTIAPDEEPRHAYRRLYEGYRRDNGIVSWAIPADVIRTTMTQLDAAWQHIHNESSGIPLDQPHPVSQPATPRVSRRLAGSFSVVAGYEPAQSDLNAGTWLRTHRENMGMTIAMLAVKTRISTRILEQIERRELASFSPTHLQAYLFEIAKALSLPLDEVRAKFGFKS